MQAPVVATEPRAVGRAIRTPRSAALAGIAFSILFTVVVVLVRSAVPADTADAGQWLSDSSRRDAVLFALGLCRSRESAFSGLSVCSAIASAMRRTGSSQPSSWGAGCCSWPCSSSPRPLQRASSRALGTTVTASWAQGHGRSVAGRRTNSRPCTRCGWPPCSRSRPRDPAAHEARTPLARRVGVRGCDPAPGHRRLLPLGRVGLPVLGVRIEPYVLIAGFRREAHRGAISRLPD